MKQLLCTINAKKFDGEIYRSWQAELIEETIEYWLFVGIFEKEIIHKDLGVIRRGTVSREYYWKNRWYNIFRFEEPGGSLRNFYCNINQPPNFSDSVLDYVDLDIDIIVQNDFSYRILDVDEFENNNRLYKYSTQIKEKVNKSVSELTELIVNRSFPFDYVEEVS